MPPAQAEVNPPDRGGPSNVFWSVSRRKEEVGPQSTEAQAVASLTLWATAPPTSSAALPSPLLWRASLIQS